MNTDSILKDNKKTIEKFCKEILRNNLEDGFWLNRNFFVYFNEETKEASEEEKEGFEFILKLEKGDWDLDNIYADAAIEECGFEELSFAELDDAQLKAVLKQLKEDIVDDFNIFDYLEVPIGF